jgi:hypothetical protein
LDIGDSNLTWLAYNVAMTPDYDISPFIIVFGVERISKSTLTSWLFYYFNLFRDAEYPKPLDPTNSDGYDSELARAFPSIAISKLPDYKKYLQNDRKFLIDDESIVTNDRRKSMQLNQLKMLTMLNVGAKKNNTLSNLTQYLSDIDVRLIKRANFLILVHERGDALVFMPQKNFAFFSYISTIETAKDNPEKLYDDNALWNVKRYHDYVMDLQYDDFGKAHPIIWLEMEKSKNALLERLMLSFQ